MLKKKKSSKFFVLDKLLKMIIKRVADTVISVFISINSMALGHPGLNYS